MIASSLISAATGASLLFFASSASASSKAAFVQFENLGYSGEYYPVGKVEALSDGNCSCEQAMDFPIYINGTNSPFNEELSVHIRGPINLQKFAFYTAESYSFGSTDGSWTRGAYYDVSNGTADNVTFLGNVGVENTCLARALNYVTSNGTSLASESTVLENVTIGSAEEFAIFSGTKCKDESSLEGDCLVYREGIDAYHGFYGTVKAFLFQFSAPSDTSEEGRTNKTGNYDMPAIWLLNAQIPRTSQYPLNGSCSAWNTGAGEFDIFEVMNYTQRNNFYTTIHDYQGTDSVEVGLQMFAYLDRTPDAVMKGGVIFGSDGKATVFLSNSTTFGNTISSSDLSSWLSELDNVDGGEYTQTLSSITLDMNTATTTSGSGSSASTSGSDSSTSGSGSDSSTSSSSTNAASRPMFSIESPVGLLSLAVPLIAGTVFL